MLVAGSKVLLILCTYKMETPLPGGIAAILFLQKILISVSLLLLFVFFVCLFEKQTILPAPVALWVWVLLYTYLFCSAV